MLYKKFKTYAINKDFTNKAFRRIRDISKSSDNEIIKVFEDKNIKFDSIFYKNFYMKSCIMENDLNKKYGKRIKQEISNFNTIFDEKFDEIALDKEDINPTFKNKFKNLSSTYFNKFMEVIPNMDAKKLMKVALILTLVVISMPTIAFVTGMGTTVSTIKGLEHIVKVFGSILLLFFMIVDTVTSFKNKNSSILGVMCKYSICLVALYSYTPIFNFISKCISFI